MLQSGVLLKNFG